jgi:ABC-2 type transport system ATP-binding protein
VQNLWKIYRTGLLHKQIIALKDVSLRVLPGKIFALLGSNGSGKTTLIKIVTGLVRPTRGSFRLWDSPLGTRIKAQIGFLPDNPHHYSFLTPCEVLSFYADIFGLRGQQKKQRIEEVLSLVKMGDHRHMRLRFFSKGMLQRIALAQALLNDPQLLILDEPIGALDPWGVRLMQEIFEGRKKAGKTVLFSSHLLHYAQEICDEFVMLDKGQVVHAGSLSADRSLEDLYLSLIPHGR